MAPPPSSLLTPPVSPNDDPPNTLGAPDVRISPVFCPGSQLDPSCPPDLVAISSDGVLFYVHSKLLLYVSQNAFAGLLPVRVQVPASESAAGNELRLNLRVPALRVQDDAAVLDLVLHAIYGLDISVLSPSPSLAELTLAVDALLTRYAVAPVFVLSPRRPLFEAVLAHAAVRPLHVYTLAARHDLEPLAVSASAHMLSFPLAQLTDADASALGPVYLRRLFFLHLGREQALKRLLLAPPAAHAPSAHCDALGQQPKVQRAWVLATAAIALNARPDTSPQTLEAALGPLLTHIWCIDCRSMLTDRMRKLIAEWSAVKRTI